MLLQIHTFRLELSMKLLAELSKLDRFDASWAAIEKREGATLKQLKSIATVRSVGASTRIEGSKMTDAEVEILLDKLSVAKLEERDEQEVAGYFEVLDTIAENFSGIDVSESSIKNLHKLMLKYAVKDEWHKGNYKQVSNAVEATMPDGTKQLVFRTTEPGIPTQDAVQQLIDWFHTDMETLPLIKAALFVYDFLSIHPFQDGNGRLSRLLTTLLLLKQGYSWIQYVSFEHEIENRKQEYYRVLMQTQRQRPNEDVTEWLNFFINCLQNMQSQLLKKLDESRAPESTSHREKKILLYIQHHPGCSSGEISRKLDLALPTVKKTLKEMVTKELIVMEGVGKATGYTIA